MPCELVAPGEPFLAGRKTAYKGLLAGVGANVTSLMLETTESTAAERIRTLVGTRNRLVRLCGGYHGGGDQREAGTGQLPELKVGFRTEPRGRPVAR